MVFSLKLSFLVIAVCLLVFLKNERAQPNSLPTDAPSVSGSTADVMPMSMDFDFYRESCPLAEKIIQSTLKELFHIDADIAPALIRLAFHDCFVHGCDASILLESTKVIDTERDADPNKSLRNTEAIDTIKSLLEETCPGVVSCADIIVLAARESIIFAGGPFYPLKTGRRDSRRAFLNETSSLPTPFNSRHIAAELFASKGFSEKELVTLLGAHSIGRVHCKFFSERLQNFNSTGGPDPSIDLEFLKTLRATCNNGSVAVDPSIRMDYEGPGMNFGTLYYQSLLQGRGITTLDQQMTSSEETRRLVEAYASDASQFQKDFGKAMVKLSNLQVITAPMGEIRRNCRRVNSPS